MKIFLIFFVVFIFNCELQAQKTYTLKLQTANNEKLVGQMIMINDNGYLTDSEGLVRLNNFSEEDFRQVAANLELPQYTGTPPRKEYRGNYLYVIVPKRSDFPLNINVYISDLKKQKEALEALIRQKTQNPNNIDENTKKEIEKYKAELANLEKKLQKKEELLEEQKVVKEKLYKEIDKLGGDAAKIRKESEEKLEAISKQKNISDSARIIAEQDAKQATTEKEKQQAKAQRSRDTLMLTIVLSLMGLMISSSIIWVIWKASNKLKLQKAEIEKNKAQIESLLLNILPKEVADELSTKGTTETKYYEHTTILFADVKGFSAMAKGLTPQQLILELDATFGKFDDIVHKHNIERIKTIGDCYMCVGGVPKKNKTNPLDVSLAALDMQKWMADEKIRRNGQFWEIRLGIHSGDLVAGVIGKTKFAFDVWGNSVNTAARMESGGEVGKVNISEATYQLVKDFFDFTPRGKIDAKNIGLIDTYFIERIKPELSEDNEGVIPNQLFYQKAKEIFGNS